MTHFTLFSYERALRLPTSFAISGLVRLGVKPRLCRSSWRAFASTHPLMLPSTCSRETLLACPPCPPWNLPSFTVEFILSTPCSRSRQGATLAHLDFLLHHDLVLWTDGSVPFPFGKGGSGVLANCSVCGTKATLSFSAGPVCSSFSAEACAILQALCWSWQHQQVCHFSSLFLLSDSRSVLATLSSPPSFLLSETLWQIWQELFFLSSCSIRLQWLPRHSFLPGNAAADELARRGALLASSTIPGSLSLLTSRIRSCLFSDLRRIVLSKFFDTQVPLISTEELVLPCHAHCVLSRLRCNGHSLLLGSFLSRIGSSRILPAATVDTCVRTPLNSFCTVQLRTLFAAHSLATLCLSTTSGPDPGELPCFWGSMVFRHAPIPRKGSDKQQQQQKYVF